LENKNVTVLVTKYKMIIRIFKVIKFVSKICILDL